MVAAIDEDPWGIPYILVVGKLRGAAPGLTETLDRLSAKRLIEDLFPNQPESDHAPLPSLRLWKEEWDVSEEEIVSVLNHKKATTATAPGPDGITSQIWKKIPGKMTSISGADITFSIYNLH